MSEQIIITTEGPLGVITLNRAEAINALNLEMIEAITATLEKWRNDEAIRAVLFEGNGPRGFCSGGDVRAARALVIAGQFEAARAYFAAEYAMNLIIATYSKPTIVLTHGVVMGGGIGIAGHCDFRFAVEGAKYAMPEAGIGFFSDVGVNAILADAPVHRALAFLMSGLAVGTGDGMELGLIDCVIGSGRGERVRAAIVAAAAGDIETGLTRVMEVETMASDPLVLCPLADRLAAAFSGATASDIVTGITRLGAGDAASEEFATTLQSRSPTSLEAIVQSHRAGKANPEIGGVLARDLALADYLSRQSDFAEGVRAVLVDKDKTPIWRPTGLSAADRAAIDAVIAHSTEPHGLT